LPSLFAVDMKRGEFASRNEKGSSNPSPRFILKFVNGELFSVIEALKKIFDVRFEMEKSHLTRKFNNFQFS
jgi:hypothetical protein